MYTGTYCSWSKQCGRVFYLVINRRDSPKGADLLLMFVPADLRRKLSTGIKVGPGWTWLSTELFD